MSSQHYVNNNKSFYRSTSRSPNNSNSSAPPPLPSSAIPNSSTSSSSREPWSLSPRRYDAESSSLSYKRQPQKGFTPSSCIGGRFSKPLIHTRSSFEPHKGVSQYKIYSLKIKFKKALIVTHDLYKD
jgi:hypothetical protein